MKILLYVLVCLFATAAFVACASQPAGQYSAAQVSQGLKDSVKDGTVSKAQADAVGGHIASAETGFPWGDVLMGVGTAAATLGLGYLGISRGDNKHIIGAEEAQALAELVSVRKAA
jgi:hypothetical protein